VALDAAIKAVPQGSGAAYHQVTRAARAALEASDSTVLTDAQWQHVDDVLAAFRRALERRREQERYRGLPSRMDTDVLSTVRSSLTVRTQEGAAVQRRLGRRGWTGLAA
jgi:hypothetical protein